MPSATKAKKPAATEHVEPQSDLVNPPTPLIRIEHYIDPDPEHPTAYARFLKRMGRIHHELYHWATIVLDSMTFMEIAARYQAQFVLNPTSKDPRQWYASSADQLEQVAIIRMGSFMTNVVLVCHVDDTKTDLEGRTLYSVRAPGRIGQATPAGYAEFYRSYVTQGEDKEPAYCLQTRSSATHGAATQIDAPNPCFADYEELWANWPDDEEREAQHCIVYGDPGTGKTTFAATWPKPMLVLAFDLLGKERPYKQYGRSERFLDEDYNIVVDHVYERAEKRAA